MATQAELKKKQAKRKLATFKRQDQPGRRKASMDRTKAKAAAYDRTEAAAPKAKMSRMGPARPAGKAPTSKGISKRSVAPRNLVRSSAPAAKAAPASNGTRRGAAMVAKATPKAAAPQGTRRNAAATPKAAPKPVAKVAPKSDPNNKYQAGTFNHAFKAARNSGKKDFTFNGKKYHTRLK